MRFRDFAYAGIGLILAASVWAAQPAAEVRIPFANYGGIQDWSADGSSALYIQGRNRRWYHAELVGACTDLPFAQRVGFVVEPSGEFDRFSAIVVHGRQCMLKSLTPSDAPPVKVKRKSATAGTEGSKP